MAPTAALTPTKANRCSMSSRPRSSPTPEKRTPKGLSERDASLILLEDHWTAMERELVPGAPTERDTLRAMTRIRWCPRVFRSTCLILLSLTLASSATGGCSDAPRPGPVTLRVMSYNIHHGEGTDGAFDYERIAAVINEQQPDLVALQEVDRKTTRAGGIDQAAKIADLTDLHHVYGAAMDYAGGAYGEAILSRWPILASDNHILPKVEGSEPRALLTVRLAPPGGQELVFAGTHLAHDSERDRTAQTRLIDEILETRPYAGAPIFLAGDLNAKPGSAPMDVLLESGDWIDAFEGDPRPTFPNVKPDRRIDWILVKPRQARVRIKETHVVEGESASDHCAVVVTLEIEFEGR